MVKRKRTLSSKENSEIVSQASDGDLGSDDTKRLKTHGSPGRVEGGAVGLEAHPAHHHHQVTSPPPLSPTPAAAEGTGPPSSTIPATISQSLPNVPSTAPPIAARPTLQLRTSARVLNKQRREETKADPPPSAASLATKKLEASGLDGDFGEEEDGKKRRRAWELWSLEDKNIFFESINECGKDFEAIQNYLTTKLRKKGAPRSQVKNKDQVRHFYYRTWHKISKYITFNEGVKKATQELYGLINFGELRKKIGGTLDERKAQKLQELIRKGSTSVRVKGKSVRVRTPICRALKKLNQIEEHREQAELRVPASVVVEVVPANVQAWCRVQGLAHNPRVRVNSPLQRPLTALLSHLQEKWRNSNLKLRDTLCSRVNFPLAVESTPEPSLRLFPARGATIKPISVQPEIVLKSSFVSLSSHEARLRRRGEKVGRGGRRRDTKQQQEKAEDRAVRDAEGTRSEAKGTAVDGKGRGDVEGLVGELEDFGEVSQEEHDDCSDGEVCCPNSPDDEVVTFSPDKTGPPCATSLGPMCIQVKEEPLDSDLPQSPRSPKEAFDPNLQVKEEGEGESGDTLRQLLALETVAGAGAVDGDGEVVCIGESTRLTAHVASDPHPRAPHPSQLVVPEEERGLAVTPEPEEEERTPLAEAEEGPEVDLEAWMQKIRSGWTLSTAASVTIGELYLIFGHNKKVCLEYEFEDQTTKVKENTEEPSGSSGEAGVAENACTTTTTTTTAATSTITATSTATSTSITIPSPPTCGDGAGAGVAGIIMAERERQQDTAKGKEGCDPVGELGKVEDTEVEEKRVAAENLSGMLAQLLAMTRMILTKSTVETCPCGHTCNRGAGVLRSPAGGRSQGLLGRSPGNTRSPRTGRVALASSPGQGVKSPSTQSGLPARPLRERNKPSSAKKLMVETLDPLISMVDARAGEGGNSNLTVETSFPPTTITPAPTLTTATTPSPSSDTLQLPLPGIGSVSPAPMAGLRVMMGDGGEFKVPVGPAPRQVHVQQANFNAQLSKLLPRYNNRPGRRVVRKNVVVQRQLPLLPKTVMQTPGVVTMKVLQPASHDKDGGSTSGFIPITIAPSPQGVGSPSPSAFTTRPQLLTPSPCPSPSPAASSSSQLPLRKKVVQPLLSPSSQVTSTVLQPLQASSGPGATTSQVQLSVLSPQLQQTPLPPPTHVTALPPGGNAISVNISGQPLLTVEMPAMVNTQPSLSVPSSQSPAIAPDINSNVGTGLENSALVNTTKNTKTNGLLNSVVSQVLSELPDLSTPPGTPQPSLSSKSPDGPSLQVRGLGDSPPLTSALCSSTPPPLLFSSALPVDPLPGLHTTVLGGTSSLATSLSLSVSSSMSSTPSLASALSPVSSLLPMATTTHLELSPPPSQTNAFSSLLNTPTSQTGGIVASSPVRTLFPTTSSINTLLSSFPPDLSKGFPNLLSGTEDQDDVPSEQASSNSVPELHIPEGSVSLPLLDISLGGTVNIAEQASSCLLGSSSQTNLREQLAAAAAHSPPTSSALSPSKLAPSAASLVSLSLGGQDSSSTDKLLDITLGSSNSNSSFSSLLAAATQPQCLHTSLLGATTVDSEGCVIVDRGQGLGGSSDGEIGRAGGGGGGSMVGGTSSFPTLSNTPPSPPSSPSRLLQQSDNQWLNNEVNDFSLSSFLGHFESPIKNSNSRSSSQVTPQAPFVPSLSSVYNENSVDFTATFAEMKAQVSGGFKQ